MPGSHALLSLLVDEAVTHFRNPGTIELSVTMVLVRPSPPAAPLVAQPTPPGVCTVLRRRLLADSRQIECHAR